MSLPIPPPPPSKAREHWERGKQRLAKLLGLLKKLHFGLGTVGIEWEKASKHYNENFQEMYGSDDGNGETMYSNFGVWPYIEEETSRRKKKRKHK